MKPKVALVRGPILSTDNALNNEATPCLAFAYIAAYLRQYDYPVSIVDAVGEGLGNIYPFEPFPEYRCQGLAFDDVIERIPADTEVIGFSGMFSGEWPALRNLISAARKRFPDAFLVAGGEHVTALTEYSLRDCPELDACVRGEGEHTFYELLEARSEEIPLSEINGIAFLDSEGVYFSHDNDPQIREINAVPRIRDINAIPRPDWDEEYLSRFWDAGVSYGVASARDMPIMASRGCPYGCTFCSNPKMWTRRYILRDVDDVIDEIKGYVKRFDITSLQFYDLTAITKRAWTIDFCKKLIAECPHLTWSLPSGTRSEALDRETLGLLKESGCVYLVYAPESGSLRTLENVQKRIDLGKLTDSVITAKKLGFVLRTNLIIGFPDETRMDVAKTILYGFRMAVLGVDEVILNIFSPYPGTDIFEALMTSGKIEANDQYFLQLTSLNSDYTKLNPFTFNSSMGPRELAFYRISTMLIGYVLGYILHPKRILRTIRNLLSKDVSAATVLEHRLRDKLRRHKDRKVMKREFDI